MSYGKPPPCACDICKNYLGSGDLYYGLSEPRHEYLVHLQSEGKIKPSLTNPKVYLSTIDDFNNWTWLNCYIDTKQKSKLNHLLSLVDQMHDLNLSSRSDLNDLNKLLSNFSENLRSLGIHEPDMSDEVMTDEKKLRRACKFGLMMARTTHFVLDEFNPEFILKPRENGKDGNIPFTTSEIRFIFRNWSILKNRVIFYLKKKKLPRPPWEVDEKFRDYFSNYAKHRNNKMNLDRKFKSLTSLWASVWETLLVQEMENLKTHDRHQ